MKKHTFTILAISLLSCGEKANKNDSKSTVHDSTLIANPAPAINNNKNWIENFREFRNAIYKNDKTGAKGFFNFPILNENNQIWYLIYDNPNISSDSITPFTEQDFDKYFNKLFPSRFINSILKIKSDSLKHNGEYETKIFKQDKNTTYRMAASFDKKENTLVLNLWSNSLMKNENGEVQDGGEFSIIYEFYIKLDGKLIFKQVTLAG
jgi:hypothetical protein